MRTFALLLSLFILPLIWADDLPKIVTLHPVLTEFVRDLVGDQAKVVNLMAANQNVHSFEPTPGDLVTMQDAVLIVAMGKHLEPYLDRIKENIPNEVKIYEAGRLVPSLQSDPKTAMFACCPVHGLSSIDPHWWQSPMAVRRAVRHLGRELERKFPESKKEIRERTTQKMDALEELHKWTDKTLAKIPAEDRKLITTHNAFGYFCAAYRFQAIPVRGITNERDPSPDEMQATLDAITSAKAKALFPESTTSGDFLKSVSESTGVPLSKALNADFILASDETYISEYKNNVTHILEALGGESGP